MYLLSTRQSMKVIGAFLLLFIFSSAHANSQAAFVMSAVMKPRGCAAVPFRKKKVAVFGGGGYLGANIFGFLQRAASLYGTGIGGPSIPRCVCATAVGSENLNKVLLQNFNLGFAGENFISLTNMNDVDAIKRNLRGIDAVFLGTEYQLDRRPVTANSYEKSPNEQTLEFYLSDSPRCWTAMGGDNRKLHLDYFRRSLEACKLAGVEHVVVIEVPSSAEFFEQYLSILNEEGVQFSYIRVIGVLTKCGSYSFEKGVQDDINVQSVLVPRKKGDIGSIIEKTQVTNSSPRSIAEEDVAAVAVQSLLSLDWEKSRVLSIHSKKALDNGSEELGKRYRFDKEWCHNADILAEKLSFVE